MRGLQYIFNFLEFVPGVISNGSNPKQEHLKNDKQIPHHLEDVDNYNSIMAISLINNRTKVTVKNI